MWWAFSCLFLFVQTYKKLDQNKKAEELDKMKAKYGLSTPETGKKWQFHENWDSIYGPCKLDFMYSCCLYNTETIVLSGHWKVWVDPSN